MVKNKKIVRVLSDEQFAKEVARREKISEAEKPKVLSEKEKTVDELKQFGGHAMLLIDGAVMVVKGLFSILTGLFKMLVVALKFSVDGYKSLNRKADAKSKNAKKSKKAVV